MSEIDLKELESFTEGIAREAGELVMDGVGTAEITVDKGKEGFATEKDIASEELIVSKILERFPDHSILAEERSTKETDSKYTWTIDPIDGTHNYMNGAPLFAVSIGLKQGDEYILGVVYLPRLDEMYIASKGNGTKRNGKRVHCSDVDTFSNAFVNIELPSELDDVHLKQLKYLSKVTFRHRTIGSIATTLAFLSAGIFDAYLDVHQQAHEWDWAGGGVLVQEAGGHFEVTENKRVIACSMGLLDDVRAFVRGEDLRV